MAKYKQDQPSLMDEQFIGEYELCKNIASNVMLCLFFLRFKIKMTSLLRLYFHPSSLMI